MKAQLGAYFCGLSWEITKGQNIPFGEYIDEPISVCPPEEADYIFIKESLDSQADFYDRIDSFKAQSVRIFFAGEAVVPDFNLFDYAIGFDELNFGDRYFKLHPLQKSKRYLAFGSLDEKPFLTRDSLKQKKFCNFIYSNPHAHPLRDWFFGELSRIRFVHSMGRHLNNTNGDLLRTSWDGDWREKKIEAQRSFMFSIAFENARHQGYVSEKIITAMLAGSIPVYWGCKVVGKYFNAASFLNLSGEEHVTSIISRMAELEENLDSYLRLYEQPWLTEAQIKLYKESEVSLRYFLNNLLNPSRTDKRRRGEGTYNTMYEDQQIEKHRLSMLLRAGQLRMTKEQ